MHWNSISDEPYLSDQFKVFGMAMLSYQQEAALFKLNEKLVKNHKDWDYFELLDIFRQLENEGYVDLDKTTQFSDKFIVYKTTKGQSYNYNWLHSEFR